MWMWVPCGPISVDLGQDVPCRSLWVRRPHMWMWVRRPHVGRCGAGGPISVEVGQEAPCGAGCSMWVHVAP